MQASYASLNTLAAFPAACEIFISSALPTRIVFQFSWVEQATLNFSMNRVTLSFFPSSITLLHRMHGQDAT
jgi:hypothetical protein